jgi:drug/metabolite transporter (DMT)-like permease
MHVLKAILLKLVSALLFAVMSALVRFLGEKYSVGQIVFFRSAFAILPVVIIYALRNELAAAVRTQRPLGHVGRGGISILGMFCNFSALARLPIVDATAISFASPLITVALAALLLKERVRIYRWSAVIVGFIGILVMLAPYFDPALHAETVASTVGLVFAISGAVSNAGSVIQTRRLTPDGDHVVHRALFLADLRGCRSSDLALRVARADVGRPPGPRHNRPMWRARSYFSDRKLPLGAGLRSGAIRLYFHDMGVSARLFFLQ